MNTLLLYRFPLCLSRPDQKILLHIFEFFRGRGKGRLLIICTLEIKKLPETFGNNMEQIYTFLIFENTLHF